MSTFKATGLSKSVVIEIEFSDTLILILKFQFGPLTNENFDTEKSFETFPLFGKMSVPSSETPKMVF